MADISPELWQAYLEQVERVFEFLEYEPNRRGPQLYLPPRVSDAPGGRRLTIDWYDDEPGNPGLRFWGKLVFHDFQWPTLLKVRRWLAYVASCAFVPWRRWLGLAAELWVEDPAEEDTLPALYRWFVNPLFASLKRLGRFEDEYMEDLHDLRYLRNKVEKTQMFADKLREDVETLQAIIEVKQAQLEDARERFGQRD
jgi:hypothetical protein